LQILLDGRKQFALFEAVVCIRRFGEIRQQRQSRTVFQFSGDLPRLAMTVVHTVDPLFGAPGGKPLRQQIVLFLLEM